MLLTKDLASCGNDYATLTAEMQQSSLALMYLLQELKKTQPPYGVFFKEIKAIEEKLRVLPCFKASEQDKAQAFCDLLSKAPLDVLLQDKAGKKIIEPMQRQAMNLVKAITLKEKAHQVIGATKGEQLNGGDPIHAITIQRDVRRNKVPHSSSPNKSLPPHPKGPPPRSPQRPS